MCRRLPASLWMFESGKLSCCNMAQGLSSKPAHFHPDDVFTSLKSALIKFVLNYPLRPPTMESRADPHTIRRRRRKWMSKKMSYGSRESIRRRSLFLAQQKQWKHKFFIKRNLHMIHELTDDASPMVEWAKCKRCSRRKIPSFVSQRHFTLSKHQNVSQQTRLSTMCGRHIVKQFATRDCHWTKTRSSARHWFMAWVARER